MVSAFDGLASNYQSFRPQYPPEIWTRIREALAPLISGKQHLVAVDVGAGTGISTRQITEVFGDRFPVVGVEPNADMRVVAEGRIVPRITYVNGQAERLPLDDNCAALVVAAQAAHWFDRPRFYAEAARVLVDGGVIAILENDRDWQGNSFLDDYESFLERYGVDYTRHYREIDFKGEIEMCGFFERVARQPVDWERQMSTDEFIGMALSSTMMKGVIQNVGEPEALRRLQELIDSYYQPSTIMPIPYRTTLTMGFRPSN